MKSFNGKPALVTASANITVRENLCIIDYDVRQWSHITRVSLHQVMSEPTRTAGAIGSIAYLVEGKADAELPEQILGCFTIQNVNREDFPWVDAGTEPCETEKRGLAAKAGGFLGKMFGAK